MKARYRQPGEPIEVFSVAENLPTHWLYVTWMVGNPLEDYSWVICGSADDATFEQAWRQCCARFGLNPDCARTRHVYRDNYKVESRGLIARGCYTNAGGNQP